MPPRARDRTTIGDRFAGAFFALFVAVPIFGLWWLLLNKALAGSSMLFSLDHLAWCIGGACALGFLAPNAIPWLAGKLVDAFFVAGRTWW
jgi:hypothetical protein